MPRKAVQGGCTTGESAIPHNAGDAIASTPMAYQQILFLLILAGGLYLFVSERLRVDVTAVTCRPWSGRRVAGGQRHQVRVRDRSVVGMDAQQHRLPAQGLRVPPQPPRQRGIDVHPAPLQVDDRHAAGE
jgi:hypothetical protein